MNLTNDLPATADVVVVGGGVLGAASAFFASRAGLRVVVVESRPRLCTLTTAAATGGVRAQFDNPEETALVQESLAFFDNFGENVGLPGYDIGLKRRGYLFITTDPRTARRQAERVQAQQSWGVTDVELLNGSEARYRFPYLSEAIISARYRADDGFIDPKRLTYGYARGSGATFVLGTTVTGLQISGGQVAGVTTSRGFIAVPNVVVAAGPFSGHVAALAGLNLDVRPVRRQKLILPDVPEVPSEAPMTIDEDNGAHWRPAFRGAFLIYTDPSETPGDPAWNVPTTADYAFLLLDPSSPHNAARTCPFWTKVWEQGDDHWVLQAGQYTYTPDHRPYLGPTAIPGLHLNVGYSGHGVMASAAGGSRVVDLLLGRADPADNPFRWDRPTVERPLDVI